MKGRVADPLIRLIPVHVEEVHVELEEALGQDHLQPGRDYSIPFFVTHPKRENGLTIKNSQFEPDNFFLFCFFILKIS